MRHDLRPSKDGRARIILRAMIYRERYIGGVLVRWAVSGHVIFLDVDWLRAVRRCQPR